MPVINRIKDDDAPMQANENSLERESALMLNTEDINEVNVPNINPPKKTFITSMLNIMRSIEGMWTESGLDHRLFYFIALIMFSNIMCGLLMMLEVVFHVRSHMLNEQLQPLESYRSPLHLVTSIFCKKCYNADYNDVDYESSDNEHEDINADTNG